MMLATVTEHGALNHKREAEGDVVSSNRPTSITVRCRLVGELRRYLPDAMMGAGAVEVPHASTVDDVLRALALPERELLIAGVNGTKMSHDTVLNDGDEVTIVAPMTGGSL